MADIVHYQVPLVKDTMKSLKKATGQSTNQGALSAAVEQTIKLAEVTK